MNVIEMTLLEAFFLYSAGLLVGLLIPVLIGKKTPSPQVVWRKESSDGTETVTTMPDPERPDNMKARRYASAGARQEMKDHTEGRYK